MWVAAKKLLFFNKQYLLYIITQLHKQLTAIANLDLDYFPEKIVTLPEQINCLVIFFNFNSNSSTNIPTPLQLNAQTFILNKS